MEMFVCDLDLVKSEKKTPSCRLAVMFLRKSLVSLRALRNHKSMALKQSETYSRLFFHLTITGHDLQILI